MSLQPPAPPNCRGRASLSPSLHRLSDNRAAGRRVAQARRSQGARFVKIEIWNSLSCCMDLFKLLYGFVKCVLCISRPAAGELRRRGEVGGPGTCSDTQYSSSQLKACVTLSHQLLNFGKRAANNFGLSFDPCIICLSFQLSSINANFQMETEVSCCVA